MDKKALSLFTKKFFILFLPLSLLALLFTLAGYIGVAREVNRQEVKLGRSCVELLEQVVSERFKRAVGDLIRLSNLEEAVLYLENPSEETRRRLAREFYDFSILNDTCLMISFVDGDGMEAVRVEARKFPHVVPATALQNLTGQPDMQTVMQMTKGEVYVAPLTLNRVQGMVQRPFLPVWQLAAPVYNGNGRNKGFLVVVFREDRLLGRFREIAVAYPGTVSLVDEQGYWLVAPAEKDEWGFMFPDKEGVTFEAREPAIWQELIGADTGRYRSDRRLFTFATFDPLRVVRDSGLAAHFSVAVVPGREENGRMFLKVIHEIPEGLHSGAALDHAGNFVWLWGLSVLFLAAGCAVYLRTGTKKEEMTERAALFVEALDQCRSAVLVTDGRGRIEYANSAYAEMNGCQPEEVMGKGLPEVIGSEPGKGNKHIRDCLESGTGWRGEIHAERKGGLKVWEEVAISPFGGSEGAGTRFIAVTDDIDARKRLEQEVNRLASFPEENPNVVLEVNLRGEITYVNPACKRLFSGSCKDGSHPLLIGLDDILAGFDEQGWKDVIDELEVGQTVFERRIKFIPRNSLLRIYAFDITHLKEIEESLTRARNEAAEAARLKSIFLANMSHEIRTPLNAIIGYTELMMKDFVEPGARERLSIIRKSGKNLLDLINDILDFSKIEAGKLDIVREEFSLQQTADHLRQMFAAQAEEKKLDYHVSCGSGIPKRVTGDVKRLTQILTNLLSNAFKFTESGSVALHCGYDGGVGVFTVSDTGIGISAEKQKVIFAEFQQADADSTRKYGGTGLGLTITRRLVELMGGELALTSAEGEGSTFTVRLPLAVGPRKKEDRPRDDGVPLAGEALVSALSGLSTDLSVLLAEDDEMNQSLIRDMLKNINLGVTVTANGQEALDRLAEGRYDLLLLDMQMPVLDGMQTIDVIRKNETWKNLYVIALTGEAMPGDAEKFLRAGCNDYLAKPIDLETFYGKIYALVAGKFSMDFEMTPERGTLESEASVEQDGEGELTAEVRSLIVNTIEGLRNNLKIFNPDHIRLLAKACEEYDSIARIRRIKQELLQVAASFDDEALPRIIKRLEDMTVS